MARLGKPIGQIGCGAVMVSVGGGVSLWSYYGTSGGFIIWTGLMLVGVVWMSIGLTRALEISRPKWWVKRTTLRKNCVSCGEVIWTTDDPPICGSCRKNL